jgi:hypothetical protein
MTNWKYLQSLLGAHHARGDEDEPYSKMSTKEDQLYDFIHNDEVRRFLQNVRSTPTPKFKDPPKFKEPLEVPSPIALDYPYRHLSGIVNGVPSAMDVDETKKRINSYAKRHNYFANPPLRYYFDTERDILDAYVKDLINAYKKKNPDILDSDISYKDLIADDMHWPEITKKTVFFDEVDDINKTPFNRIHKFFTGKPGYGGAYQPMFRALTVPKGKLATLYHEMSHADDSLYGGFLDNLTFYKNLMQKGQHSDEYFDPNKDYKDIFEISNLSGETRHHIPLQLNGKEEPAMLLGPFLKAGMQADTTPETNWNKIKKIFK